MQQIIKHEAWRARVEPWELRESRDRALAPFRQRAMARTLQLKLHGTGKHPSSVQVGRWFDRDHSTVLHAKRAVREREEAEARAR